MHNFLLLIRTSKSHVKSLSPKQLIMNCKPFTETDGVKQRVTGRQIAALVSDNPNCTEVFLLEKAKPKAVPLDQEIEIKNCDYRWWWCQTLAKAGVADGI